MHPVMIKFIGLIIASMIVFSPSTDKPVVDEKHSLEYAQVIADRTGQMVTVWMDKSGHVSIQSATDKPVEPYTILHSNWRPRK